MGAPMRGAGPPRCLLLLAAVLTAQGSQLLGGARPKVNSIKLAPGADAAAQGNRSAVPFPGLLLGGGKKSKHLGQAYPCSSDKECEVGRYCHSPQHGVSACMGCRRRKKRCHRDGMCCPATRCNNGICIPVTESILTPHIPALDSTRHRERNHGHHHPNHDLGWQNLGRPHTKMSHVKGHEGDPCLRSSDCTEGFCCARHFWTKICKPVLLQGEVCTKQRKKGTHGLEIFQRCDCAKGLACRVWKDTTYSSKARLHACQKL